MRKTGSVQWASHVYLVLNYVSIWAGLLAFGGAFSPFLLWFLLLPVLALVINGREAGKVWLIIISVSYVILFGFVPGSFPTYISDRLVMMVFCINFIALTSIIFLFQNYLVSLATEFFKVLKVEKDKNQLILEELPVGVAFIDPQMKVSYINPTMEKFTGILKEDVIGNTMETIVDKEMLRLVTPYLQRAIRGEIVRFEKNMLNPVTNQLVTLRVIYVPRRNEHNEVTDIISLTDDITLDRKAAEEKRRQEQIALKTKLESRNRELASQQLFITNQTNVLREIRSTILDIQKGTQTSNNSRLQSVVNNIDLTLASEDHWESFQIQFDRIHPDFTQRLQNYCPQLTTRDLRHCAYIKLNLTYKEMANLLGVSYKTVEMTNYRIKKKLQLDQGTRLGDFIRRI
ncbi:MAG: PAS domain-containing protein [Bacteroidota bacterium]